MLWGRAWATVSGRAFAHLWVKVWNLLEDRGLQPIDGDTADEGEQGLRIYKIKSHLGAAAKAALSPERAAKVKLNEEADSWAKIGAKQVQKPQWLIDWVNADLQKVKTIASYIASFRVLTKGLRVTSLPPRKAGQRKVLLRSKSRPKQQPTALT